MFPSPKSQIQLVGLFEDRSVKGTIPEQEEVAEEKLATGGIAKEVFIAVKNSTIINVNLNDLFIIK